MHRRVPALPVGAQGARRHHLDAGELVRQRGLARTGGPEHGDGLTGAYVHVQRRDARSGRTARDVHCDPGGRTSDVVRIGYEVGLGQHNHGPRAALPGEGEQALDPTQVRFGEERLPPTKNRRSPLAINGRGRGGAWSGRRRRR